MADKSGGISHTITVVSGTVLVAVELLVAGIAGGWALAGMFGLGEIGAWVLEALGAALALYLVWKFFRTASSSRAAAAAAKG
jgi:hypothetical protein